MNHHNPSNRATRVVLAVAFLGTGLASAQTRPTLELRSAASTLRGVTPANANRSSALQSLNIDRAALRPLDVKRIDMLSGSSQSRVVEVAAWPVALIMPGSVPVLQEPVAPGGWMPSVLDSSRGNFTNIGVYDR